MILNLYYNSTGTTPLEEAEKNLAFYNQLVIEYGYTSALNLFPAEQLQQLLLQLIQYRTVAPETLIGKIDTNVVEYRNLYKKLTNQDFITYK